MIIDRNVTINGPGANQMAISGDKRSRIFFVDIGARAHLEGLMLRDGKASDGGAIYDLGALTVTNSTLVSNSVTGAGGGIYSYAAPLTVHGSDFRYNSASSSGGGIHTEIGVLEMIDADFLNNSTSMVGGAVHNLDSTLRITDSTFISNTAMFGGGIMSGGITGTLTLTGSTFTGNRASFSGGGVTNGGTFTATNTTFSENSADFFGGGAIYNGGIVRADGCTFAGNRTATSGGAVYNGGWITLAGCALTANAATGNGGGIYNGGALTVTSSSIVSCTAYLGGGLYNDRGAARVNGSTFATNTALSNGGGIGNNHISATLSIVASSLISNGAQTSGGGLHNNRSLASIAGSTIAGNIAAVDGGGIANISGTVNILTSTLITNVAQGAGGGVAIYDGHLSITDSILSNNVASLGGAISNDTAVATVTHSSILSNTATSAGGGVNNEDSGVATVSHSTLSHNTAPNGGGAMNDRSATLNVADSTLSSNNATQSGGAIANAGASTLHVDHSTLADNGAIGGGGIENQATLHLRNTIVAGSRQGGDCHNTGALAANIKNLVEDGSCSPALQGNPLLGPLAQNGGATATHALLPGSPAIDAGDATVCAAVRADQRGVTRPQGAACDIGAFEARGFNLAVYAGDNQRTLIGLTLGAPLVAAISGPPAVAAAAPFTDPVEGGRVVFTAPSSGAGALPTVYTATITAATAVVTPTANLTPGRYLITAGAIGAIAPVTFTLTNQVTTTTHLTTAPNPSAVGETVTFTATVAALATSIAPTGVVTFAVDGGLLGAVTCDAAGVATVRTANLVTGTFSVTAHYGGSDFFITSDTAPMAQEVQPLPTARNDAMGALRGIAATLDPRVNDLDPAGGGLTILAVGQPAHASVQFDDGAIRYTADPTITAIDTFTYTLRDRNGRTDTAWITVVVASAAETDAPPQIGAIDNTTGARLDFAHGGAVVTVLAPAGVYTGALDIRDILFLAFTPVTQTVDAPPATLHFGNLAFDLELFVNDTPLSGDPLPQPLTLVIAYDPALLAGLSEASLTLLYWDGS